MGFGQPGIGAYSSRGLVVRRGEPVGATLMELGLLLFFLVYLPASSTGPSAASSAHRRRHNLPRFLIAISLDGRALGSIVS